MMNMKKGSIFFRRNDGSPKLEATMLIAFDLLQLQKYPSPNAMVLAESISGLGQQYNRMDASSTDCSVSFSLFLIDLHFIFY